MEQLQIFSNEKSQKEKYHRITKTIRTYQLLLEIQVFSIVYIRIKCYT